MPSSSSIAPGTVLAGRYDVQRLLGRGGMASVHAAFDRQTGTRVAVKILASDLVSSPSIVERFLREGHAVAALRSPNVCRVHEVSRAEDGVPFLVLELLEGESLFDAIQREGRLPPGRVVEIVTQLCRGLADAHAAGVVHRDLKPENVLLSRDETGALVVKLIDFGLARFERPLGRSGARLTRPGAVFGTPAYMSPEQVLGQGDADARSDLWAVACMTYESLTGVTVWRTDRGVAATFEQIANAPIPDPRRTRPELPPSFSAWLDRALAREPGRRFPSAEALAEALARAFDPEAAVPELPNARLSERASTAPSSPDPARQRRGARMLVAGVFVAVIAVAVLCLVGSSWLR